VIAKILPPSIDNTYRGHKIALWLFAVVLLVRITQSVVVIVSGYSVARSADGSPLETFGPAAAQTAVALFGLSALNRLFILLLGALTLVRYRSAVPLMFVVLMLNYLAGQLLLQFVPLVRTGTPPGPLMNLMLFVLMVIGLPLSLWHRGEG
jgi:hypothetical protein